MSDLKRQIVKSYRNECAGVPSQPTRHENPTEKTMPESSWKSALQMKAERMLAKWFGKGSDG